MEEGNEAGVTDMLGSMKDLIFAHWSLLVVALVLGITGNFFKTQVWTKERATLGKPKWLWWWGRASLPLHAPLIGFLVGTVLIVILGDKTPVGPGVNTAAEICLYYTGSGVLSAWAYAILKHFMKSRGIVIEDVQMSSDRPPPAE